MKTKTNFATTSDVRNLINATMEAFPKGPVRDGIQTKMFNFWDNLNAGNNLPAGSDRNRFHAEALDNYKAAIRMAISLGSKRDSSYEMKVTELERKLTGIKVGKNEMAKVEDKFYGKRVVKGIFARVNISAQINKAKQLGAQMARENKSSEYGDSRWNALLNETYKMVGGENTDQGSSVSSQLRAAWKSANEKEQSRIENIQLNATIKLEKTFISLKDKLVQKGFCSNKNTCSPQDKALQQEMNAAHSYLGTTDQEFISLIRKITNRLNQPFATAKKNSRIGSKSMFALNKAEAINEVKVLKLAISKLEPQLEMYKNRLKEAVKYYKSLVKGEGSFSRTGVKTRFANDGTKTALFLAKIDSKSKSMILENVANRFGISAQAALVEVTDSEAENLLDYMTEPARSAASVLMQKHGSFARTGAKVKFANKDINLKIASLRSKILKLNELLQNAKETENTQEFARLVQKIKIEEKNLKVAYDVANLYGGI